MRIRAVAIVFSIVGAVLLGSAGSAVAAPSRATLLAAANAVEYENVGGSNYAHYKAKYPTALNWSKDGCSVPKYVVVSPALALVLRHYSGIFQKSCDRHDFGYRNYGKNTSNRPLVKLDPTRARKNSIDSRFLSNMNIQCDRAYTHLWEKPAKAACKGAAKVYYTAVSKYGDKAFFG